jgi:2-keto-4-pentenoate hydratase/2-oxohepta-3-ene-1,7-dioic acid hydratase in catechol pathway
MAAYARLLVSGRPRYALDQQSMFHLLSDAPWATGAVLTGEVISVSEAQWLPVTDATKVVAIGQNYRKHAAEMGKSVPEEPLIFTKPRSSLNGHLGTIVLPPASQEVHYEAELALVIGQTLTRATVAQAQDAIFALTCFNDVTARDIQRREVQHTRAKGYDTFSCCGPVMVTGLAADSLRVQSRLNGRTTQDASTSDMVHRPAALVAFISNVMTLMPGDLVSTGTPSGVGPLGEGDWVEVEVEGVGILRNRVSR